MKRIKKFQKGGFSVEGFRRDSPDRNNSVNYINSSNISMRGVDFPVHATDNTGVSKLLMPGNEYKFPGSVVREIPLKQQGGSFDDYYKTVPQYKNDTSGYNLREWFKRNPIRAQQFAESDKMHAPDSFKTPPHKTFSDESIYFNNSNRDSAGHWIETPNSWMYVPFNPKVKDTVIENKQTGGKINPPIYTNDPKDPRLQAYNDSLYASNVSSQLSKIVKPNFDGPNVDSNGDLHSLYGIQQFLNKHNIDNYYGVNAHYKGIRSQQKEVINDDYELSYPNFKVPVQPIQYKKQDNIPSIPILQPTQAPTSIEQQQFQQTSMEPVRMTGHTYNSNYLGDVSIDGVQQKDRGGKIPKDSSKFIDSNEFGGQIMQHGGVNGIPMIPDPMPTNPLSRDGIFGNDGTAPMQSMDSYPHIKRMNEIQDSLTNEAQNHIDNKQYYGENTIKLNNGNFRGANVDTQLIDDIIASAKRKKVDPWTMLGVAGQESALGANGYWNKDQHQVMSGWNAANNIKPETDNLFLADHRVPGVNAVKGHTGIGADITNADSTEHYLTQHPQLIDNYRNSQGAKIPQGKVPLMDLTADYIKQKGVQGYNPGDPDYTNKVNKRIQELKTDPVMKKYIAGKKTMQDGGPTQNMRDNYENAMGWMQSNKYDVNNPALRHNSNIGKGYFDQYNNANPGKQFNTTDIPVMQKYFRDNANSGQVRSTNPYNRGFSPVDNYPADQTLNSRQMTYQTQNGNNVQNFGTNQNAALSSVNSWKQLPPQWQANDQNIPMANNTGYRPTPRGTARTQQNNWHTGENTDYSIDSTRTAQMGGNYLGYMEQEPAREMMQSGGMITAGVTPIDNRKQPFGKKGYFWNGECFEKSTGSTVNGTAFSKYGGELPRALEFAYLENGGYVDDDGDIDEMKHGGIHIKPENKGKFIAYKQRTGKTTEEALHSKDPHVRQMANFARNSKSWSHKQMGGLQKFMQGGGGMDIPGASNVGVVNNNSQETLNEAYAPVQNAYNNSIYNSPNNQWDNIAPDSAGGGNNGYTPQRKQQYPWGDALGETANIAMGYGELIKGRNQQRDLHGYQQSHGQTDTAFGAQKLDTSGQKGDYSINTGNFRPNQQNFSAPGYFPGQMALGGQVEGIHDLDEHTINDLRNKGYRIEYL